MYNLLPSAILDKRFISCSFDSFPAAALDQFIGIASCSKAYGSLLKWCIRLGTGPGQSHQQGFLWCTQGSQPCLEVPDPPRVSGTKFSYEEQKKLLKWVKSQIVAQGHRPEFMPSEKTLNEWDSDSSKAVSTLSRALFKSCKSRGLKPEGARVCLAEAWGFVVRPRKKAGYSLDTLRKDVLACNQFWYAKQQQPCDKVDLTMVIIFTVKEVWSWCKGIENLHAVLGNAVSTGGPGLMAIAEQLGMSVGKIREGKCQLNKAQPGQGPLHKRLKELLTEFNMAHKLPEKQIPTYSVLKECDCYLAGAVSSYKSDERANNRSQLTGRELLAQDIGWSIAPSKQYPNGYWVVRPLMLLCISMQCCNYLWLS